MSDSNQFNISMELVENYVFKIDFGDFGDVITDEPPPLGSGEGPNPARLVAAAVGNCLCASLLFSLRKFKDQPGKIRAQVTGQMERQDGRWRISKMDVTLQIDDPDALQHLPKALQQFEDFCVVTQSIRQGIPVSVTVQDTQGKLLTA
jgi:uncharacterized OsmC-like protein